WVLETQFDVLNASPVYLLAVVITALLSGTVGALLAAVSGILIYDYLFTHPFQNLAVSDPAVWLNLILLLFVGLVVGQLTALERSRAVTAETREREARELFLVSRALATRSSTTAVLSEIAEVVRHATGAAGFPIARPRDCWRPPRTRSGRRWPRISSLPRPAPPRSRARATRSR